MAKTTFQKRHYIRIAKLLYAEQHNANDGIGFMTLLLGSELKLPQTAWCQIGQTLCQYNTRQSHWPQAFAALFNADNEHFDRDRFLHCCNTGTALGENIDGGPAVGQYGYSGHKWDRTLGR